MQGIPPDLGAAFAPRGADAPSTLGTPGVPTGSLSGGGSERGPAVRRGIGQKVAGISLTRLGFGHRHHKHHLTRRSRSLAANGAGGTDVRPIPSCERPIQTDVCATPPCAPAAPRVRFSDSPGLSAELPQSWTPRSIHSPHRPTTELAPEGRHSSTATPGRAQPAASHRQSPGTAPAPRGGAPPPPPALGCRAAPASAGPPRSCTSNVPGGGGGSTTPKSGASGMRLDL